MLTTLAIVGLGVVAFTLIAVARRALLGDRRPTTVDDEIAAHEFRGRGWR